MTFHSRLSEISSFIFDMDGVLTDGTLSAMPGGELLRRFNIKDGFALKCAMQQGFQVAIISGGVSPTARQRFIDLGIRDVFMGVADKISVFTGLLEERKLDASRVLYMGDDLPDLEVMKIAGLAACPADACREIRAVSSYISPFAGGNGCVRDVIELVMRTQRKWNFY